MRIYNILKITWQFSFPACVHTHTCIYSCASILALALAHALPKSTSIIEKGATVYSWTLRVSLATAVAVVVVAGTINFLIDIASDKLFD